MNDIQERYFDWMYKIVYPNKKSYKKLLRVLYETDFNYILPMDGNRAEDGIELRYDFGDEAGYNSAVIACELDNRPCSVLEMMVALASRCENQIMHDPDIGDRTSEWFSDMIESLGLGSMTDRNFNQDYVETVLYCFMDRRYSKDGHGGLFTIPECKQDLRYVEIWYQMNWYLESVMETAV